MSVFGYDQTKATDAVALLKWTDTSPPSVGCACAPGVLQRKRALDMQTFPSALQQTQHFSNLQ